MKKSRKTKRPVAEPLPQLPDAGAVIGYARVSTTDQDLGMQVDALTRYGCQRIFFEKLSGAKHDRPELNKAVQSLREGDTLVIWKLDRLGRSAIDIWQKVQHITEDLKARLYIITQNIDTSSSMGRAMMQLLGVFAELERELTRERTRAGVQRRKDKGLRVGRMPVLSAEQIAEAQKLRNNRVSVREIADLLDCAPGTVTRWTQKPKWKTQERQMREG